MLAPPRLSPVNRSFGLALAATGTLMVLGGAVLFWFDPMRYPFYPICIFHKSTGLLCPGCGGLRAIHQLLHGHLAVALRLNALLVLALPGLGWLGASLAVRKWRNQPVTPAIRPWWLWCALATTFLFGILRNLPFAQVAWLAP